MVTAVRPAPPPSRARVRTLRVPGRLGWIAAGLSLPGVLWVALWFGVNTGPGVLDGNPRTLAQEIHYLRTLLPLFALGVASLCLLARAAAGHDSLRRLPPVLWPWLLYGAVALLACTTSPHPAHAAYWALCYLAAFVVLWAFVQAPTNNARLDRCRHLLHVTWVVAGVLLLALVYIARDKLFVPDYGGHLTGYGIVNRVGPTAGVGMVRASGFARFAAVPAIVAFVFAWRGTGMARLLWGGLAAGAATTVYLMQSRGATLGLVAALAFAMLFIGRRSRVVGVLALVFVLFSIVTDFGWTANSERVMHQVARQRDWQEYSVTSGRTRDWSVAWRTISSSPLWGWGPQADRYLLRLHVHNTYLYAWLAAGAVGVGLFLLGILWSWRLLVRALRDRSAAMRRYHTTLIQVGCLLAFFSVRGIPEVSGAMFGVDVLLMLPVLAWLGSREALAREVAVG